MGFLAKVFCPKEGKLTDQKFSRKGGGKWKCPCGAETKHPPPKRSK